MLPAAIDFLIFFRAQLFIVESAFGLADKVKLLLALRHERPVGIIGPMGVSILNQEGSLTKSLTFSLLSRSRANCFSTSEFVFDGVEQGFVAILHLV